MQLKKWAPNGLLVSTLVVCFELTANAALPPWVVPPSAPTICKVQACFNSQAAMNAYESENNCLFPTTTPANCTPATAAYWGTMSVSGDGVSYTKSWEKFRAFPYNDSNNNATIGYGSFLHRGPVDATDIAKYPKGITLAAANALFAADMTTKSVNYITAYVHVQLTQCQLDALADFVFNVGGGNLQISQVLKDINSCNLGAVAGDFLHFVKGGAGLVIRRNGEGAIWTGCNYQNHV